MPGDHSNPSASSSSKPFHINLPSLASAATANYVASRIVLPPSRPPPSAAAASASAAAATGPPRPYIPSSTFIGRSSSSSTSSSSIAGGGGGRGAASSSASASAAPPYRPGAPARPPPQQGNQAFLPPRLVANPSAGAYIIAVNPRQQGNPILKHLKNVPHQFVENIVPDFVLGSYTCCLFISLRYHLLNPQYLIRRIKELRRDYRLRVILCLVDVEDNIKPLHELNRMALLESCTLILSWSIVEAARYIETYKAYETKPCDSIQERVDADYMSQLTNALTTLRSVNKTDVVTLSSNFGSLASIMNASREELVQCPGLGEKKVQRLWEAFHEPFVKKPGQRKAQRTLDDLVVKGGAAAAAGGGGGGGETAGEKDDEVIVIERDDPLDYGSDHEEVDVLLDDEEVA